MRVSTCEKCHYDDLVVSEFQNYPNELQCLGHRQNSSNLVTVCWRTSSSACSTAFPPGVPMGMKFSSVTLFWIKELEKDTGRGTLKMISRLTWLIKRPQELMRHPTRSTLKEHSHTHLSWFWSALFIERQYNVESRQRRLRRGILNVGFAP